MELNYFDIIASVIILLLGLKGIINGFFKELFGLIGIIGGIFLASRFADSVGGYLSDLIFKFESPAAVSFTGFLTTLALFWLLMITLGYIFKKLSIMSGMGPIDRIFGFVFGAGKFFLIAAIISFAVYNVKALQSTLNSVTKGSILFPVLVETGGYIMKIDPTEMSQELNDTISQKVADTKKNIETKVEQTIHDSSESKIAEIKKVLKEK